MSRWAREHPFEQSMRDLASLSADRYDVADIHDGQPCADCLHRRDDHDAAGCRVQEHIAPYSPLGGLADTHLAACRCCAFVEAGDR